MSTQPARLTSVNKSFEGRAILNHLDWNIEPGKVVGLLGRNGAGKTTLIESMLGLQAVDGGSIKLFGDPVDKLTDATRARIGYVPQQSDIFEWFTPRRLMAYFKGFYPKWNDGKVEGLLSRWSIAQDQSISSLSLGEKQRLSIIRALAHEPEFLVLDEPVASLDPLGRRDFLRELVDLVSDEKANAPTTIVFSTHILSDLERVAVDVAFLKDGKLVLQEPLDQLLESVRRITGPTQLINDLKLSKPISIEHHGEATRVVASLSEREMQQRSSDGITMEAMTLEDLFIEVTR